MVALSLRARETQDEHVLGHPAFLPGHVRGDPERQALFPQEGVSTVARAVGPDEVLLGEVADVLLLDRGAGPEAVLLPRRKRRADGVQTGDEFTVLPQR